LANIGISLLCKYRQVLGTVIFNDKFFVESFVAVVARWNF